jgi:hypothetical protein
VLVHKPSITDLEALAHFFGIPITQMFPQSEVPSEMKALWSAMDGLKAADRQEVIRYALFRRAIASSNQEL